VLSFDGSTVISEGHCHSIMQDSGLCLAPPSCGDGSCNGAETCSTCPTDCGVCPADCGNGICDGTETSSSCPEDCVNPIVCSLERCQEVYPSTVTAICSNNNSGESCINPITFFGNIVGDCAVDEWCSCCGPAVPENRFCRITQEASCPASATAGETFTVSYEFQKTGGSYPYEVRSRLIDDVLESCVWDENLEPAGEFQSESHIFTCPVTPGFYDFKIRCEGATGILEDNCNNTDAEINTYVNAIQTCNVHCMPLLPLSIGFIKIQTLAGIIKLNLISASDAISEGNGVVKIAKTAGDTNTAADLVATNDPDASPVRVMTPYGIRSWRKID